MAGNIVKLNDGRYRLRYKDYSKYIKAKSPRDAEKQLAAFLTEMDSGDFSKPSKITFREFANKYLEEYAKVELAPKTIFRYKEMLESRIVPALGNKRLEKITPLDLLAFYSSLRGTHKYMGLSKGGEPIEKPAKALSEATIKHHHRLICSIFEKAIKWGILKGNNPAKHVDAPKNEKKKANCFTEEQIRLMLEALNELNNDEIKYKTATIIALVTGARLGEIMGLEWQDINIENNSIEIRQSSQYLPGQGIFTKNPKNETSKRKISVNDSLISLLNDYKKDQREKGFICTASSRLFINWEGKPMHPYTVTKWFPKFLEKNGMPRLNFHGLRHTSATFLISQGMDIQTVASRLGHSTSATTQNIYSHFMESKDRKAAELMEGITIPKSCIM